MALSAGFQLKINGADATPDLNVSEIRVEDNLMAPDTCTLRMPVPFDPGGTETTKFTYKVGDSITVSLAAATDQAQMAPLFDGEIVSLEPEFTARRGLIYTIRAYDRSHRLNREKHTRTFLDVTYSDAASKVIGEAGLSAQVEDSPGGTHPFLQQSGETDWNFLWRLAARVGFEVYAEGEKVHFRPVGGEQTPVELELGKALQSFRARVTGVQQVNEVTVRGWDPKAKQEIVGTANGEQPASSIGIKFNDVKSAFPGKGSVLIGNAPVTSANDATAVAKSVLAKMRDSWLDADGEAAGDPKLRAGAKVSIKGLGSQYSGDYVLTSTTHVVAAERGYHVRFRISGRTQRTLLDLVTPTNDAPWANGLVIGVVTNNNDPDKMGRVRVKFPTLAGDLEGWWGRVLSLNAGKQRGVLMLPQVGDEVVVGFEHGDPTRPFVVGSLWNGKDQPTDMDAPEGNFELWSDEKVHIKAKKDVVIETDASVTVKAKSNATVEAQGNATVDAKGNVTVKAGGTGSVEATGPLTLKGMGVTVDGGGGVVKVSGSQIMLG